MKMQAPATSMDLASTSRNLGADKALVIARPGTKSGAGQTSATGQGSSLAHQALRQFLLDMVALIYDVELSALAAPTRGRKPVAFARQVAMYLAHTGGGLSLTVVGRLFARDRTTVAHACALVEDARDDAVFDRTLGHLESAIACQMDLFARSIRHEEKNMVTRQELQA